MGFDPASLFGNLVLSSIGLALLVYGKKAERWPQVIAGILLLVEPYVVSGGQAMCGVGLAIVAGLAAALYLGW
jgi:hypothetical protein